MPNDWTSSETISPPDQIKITWKVKPAGSNSVVDKSVPLQSTTSSTSRTEYQTFAYNDAEGKPQTQDVAVFKRDVKTATIASVNSAYVTYRVQNALGLPLGNAENVSETTTEYAITTEGPVKIKDTTVEQISYVQFVGSLSVPSYEGFRPGTYLVIANKTVVEYENVRTASGRDMTRTKTSRWIAQGLSQEGQQSAKDVLALVDGLNGTAGNPALFDDVIQTYIPLIFEGTEVQTSTGREPVPSRPSEQDSIKDEVTNGDTNADDTTITPEEKYGNGAWTSYVPPGIDPKTLQGDSNGDGVPDWAPYVPQDYTDYDQDSNSDGTPDWAPYVPTSWEDLNQDSNGNGVPDWAPFVPTQWQDYDQDSNNNGVPDWAPYVPQVWQDYRGDANNDGVPDWAPFVPGNWQDLNQDTNGDGVPDWATYVPTGWQDFDQDTNNDGTPDWAVYVPTQWQDFNQDSNGDGVPDWSPYIPTQWQDYDTDTNNDGTPDWAPYVPTGWEDFDTKDTDYTTDTVTVDNTKTVTGVVRFDGSAYDSTDDTTTATYEMPYAPDSFFQILKGQRVLTPGGALAAAEAFGRTESALDIGHAYGQNIVSGFNEIPSDDLSPLYLRIAGIEGAFLCDSISYAWGPEGMVVSSDLMLIGVTGYYGSSAPATSWLRLPVASTGLTAAGATTTEAYPVKANSIAIPNNFSGATPAPTLAQLPTNGSDVFAEWRQGANIIGPTLTVELLTAFTGPYLSSREFEYAFTLEAETAAVASGPFVYEPELDQADLYTAPFAALDDNLIETPVARVTGTAEPLLGNTGTTLSTAEAAGWTRIFNGANDEGSVQVTGFPFNVVVNGVPYTSCWVTSNGYLMFEFVAVTYQGLSASGPAVPKLHFGAGDYAYQSVYKKIGTNSVSIRWEGSTSYSATTADRFIEINFYKAKLNGTRFIEVRAGSVDTPSPYMPLMLATASTALASATFDELESWVFEGNSDGTSWTAYTGQHVELS
jgi:hypothetical protein